MHKKLSMKNQTRLAIVVLLGPAVIWMVVWTIFPAIYALYLSFTNYNLLKPNQEVFIFLDNYIRAFKDAEFLKAVKNTFIFCLAVVPAKIVLGLFFAYIANKGKIKNVFRVIYYLPCITSGVTVATIFLFLFNKTGVINRFLSMFGFEATTWISNPKLALPLVIIMAIWCGVGFNMLIFVSAFQGVPTEIYEAADIDGAGAFRKMYAITLPLIVNQIFLTVVTGVIGALQVFELAYVSSGGNGSPDGATSTIIMYIYNKAFTSNTMGYASAVAFILFAMIFIMTLIQKLVFKEDTSA